MGHDRGILSGLKIAIQRRRLGELLVIKGLISSQELKSALKEQKEAGMPLGQFFVERSVISKNQLRWLLAKQSALRACAAVIMFMSFSSISSKKAKAAEIADIPAKITLASVASDFTRVKHFPSLYGTKEKRSTNLKAFTKWSDMFARFERDLSNKKAAAVIQQWREDLGELQGGSIKTMAAKVNDFVNEQRYIVDSKNWGRSDYWATPAEFLQRGGDCEDFAIAKYAALRAMGVPEERLRVMIVQDTYKDIPHAVLVVYTESGAFILDNQIKTLISTDTGNRYRPIFSINRYAWWLHTKPENRTVVASAR